MKLKGPIVAGVIAGSILAGTGHAGDGAALAIDLPAVRQPKLMAWPADLHCRDCTDAERARVFNGVQMNHLLYRAGHGDAHDQIDLAAAYLRGDITPRDNGQAVQWLTRAADSGSIDAMYELGALFSGTSAYSNDKGLIDGQRAIFWFDRAADAGDGRSGLALAQLYGEGRLVPRDEVRVEAWYRRAAMDGEIPAELKMAELATARNQAADAFAWYRRAAAGGDAGAMAVLCTPPDAFGADLRTRALAACASHLKVSAIRSAADLAAVYSPETYFDLTRLPEADRAALTRTLVAAMAAKVEAAYPARADENGVEGWAEVDCRWGPDGNLSDCAPADEAPKGYGFGRAAAGLLDATSGDFLPGAHPGMWSRLRLIWRQQAEQ